MMRTLFTLLMTIVPIAGTATAKAGANTAPLVYGQNVRGREGLAQDYDRASRSDSHAGATFTIDAAPEIVGKEIRVKGYLENTGATQQTAFIRVRPFTLELKDMKSAKPQSEAGALTLVDLPPKSKTEFDGTIDLENYDYQGSPDAVVQWKFNFWTAPFPRGELKEKLPLKAEVADVLKAEIGTMTNSARPDEKTIVASLRNVSGQLQEPRIEQKGEWTLTDSNGNPVTDKKSLTVSQVARTIPIQPGQAAELERASLEKSTLKTEAAEYRNLKSGTYVLKFRIENANPTAKSKSIETTTRLDVP